MRILLIIIFIFFLIVRVFAQDSASFFSPSPDFNKKRFAAVAGTQIAGYGGSLALLSYAWYKDYDQSSFHFFDDGNEWLQMDKAGHFLTAWYLGGIGTDMMRWSGAGAKRSVVLGTAGSFLYLTGIELLDGFSDGWGFSWTDFTANALGTGLIAGQKLIQNKQNRSAFWRSISHSSLKFSFHETRFTEYRPALLGSTLAEQILKDYNGQSYWLSCNISSLLHEGNKFPSWLNVALGYGGENMISGKPGYVYMDGQGNTIKFQRYRQYYLSLDIDLTKIKTRSSFLKTVFKTISFIKIPAPAVEVNKHGVKFHPMYF